MNAHTNSTPTPLVYNGEIIHQRDEMLSLTDMWKAAGEPNERRPSEWLRSADAVRFIEFLAEASNMGNSHITKTTRGAAGGTFGHWQIGLAYAKYLSPEFHMWCNTVVRERMEGRHQRVGFDLTDEMRQVFGGIVKGIVHKELAAVVPTAVETALLADPRRAALDLVSVRQMLDGAKALQKKRNSLNRRVGRALSGAAAVIAAAGEAFPARKCPHTGVWLYKRDFADSFMRARGNAWVSDHNAAVTGQGVIPFPTRLDNI